MWTAKVTADKALFNGRDILAMDPAERRKIIGKDISMIFQEPMASLNPCFTVGFQIEEVLRIHMGLGRQARREPSSCSSRSAFRSRRSASPPIRTRCRAASASA